MNVNFDRFNSTIDELGEQGINVATLFKDNFQVSLETNGSDGEYWYEIVIYEDGCEVWFSEPIYEEEKPKDIDKLEGLLLDCLELV